MALFCEPLENRQLLSGGLQPFMVIDGGDAPDPTDGVIYYTAAPAKKAAIRNLVGSYHGSVSVDQYPGQLIPADLIIASQTSKGNVKGSITIQGISVKFSLKGTINSKGQFNSTFSNKRGDNGSLSGKVTKKGSLTGTFIVNSSGNTLTGSFTFTKNA